MQKPTQEDKERVKMLDIVSKKGIKHLDLIQLERLQILIERKDYSHDKKAHKSKMKLLAEITVQAYKIQDGLDK